MKDLGAVFGSVYGWERPGWFAPKDYALTKDELASPDVLTNHNYAPPTEDGRIVEKWSFRRSNYFPFVGEECRNVMNNVGAAGHVGLRQDGGVGAGRARLARLDPRQPHPEEDGPHRALPPAHAARRRARRVHRLRMGAGPLLSRLRRRL